MDIYDCERVSIGELERPAILILESHGQFNPPPHCTDGDAGIMRMVEKIVTNDANVASVLSESYDIDSYVADIELSIVEGPPERVEMEWTVEGHPSSKLVMYYQSAPLGEVSNSDRWFSPFREGMAWIQIERNAVVPTPLDLFPSTGHMSEPMLPADFWGGDYLGRSSIYYSMNGTAEFTFFRDLQCEQPW